MRAPASPASSKTTRNLWYERVMAIAAIANFGLVVFDLTYVPWRDFWLQGRFQIPVMNYALKVPMPDTITRWYDPVKGIEPNRETREYLEVVRSFEQNAMTHGVVAPEAQLVLSQLRSLSDGLIMTNPFQTANKSGTLEKIKNHLRERIYGEKKGSAREAFQTFWSADYLSRHPEDLEWFNQTIRPLIETNYYRTIAENGDFTNNFGMVEGPLVALFGFEFLVRTFWMSRQKRSLSWFDAMIRRWYDIPLFFPFWLSFPVLGLTRAIPTAIRLHQARLVNLNHVRDQVVSMFVGSIAEELTSAVVVQVIDQTQAMVRRGELGQLVTKTLTQPRVEINDTDEVAAISTLLVKLTVYQVLPKIRPDLEILLNHSIDAALKQSPAYQGLRNLPGIGSIPTELSKRVVKEVIDTLYKTVTTAIEDPIGTELTQKLVQNLGQTFSTELQEQKLLQEIQTLLHDLLEEVKLTFAQEIPEVPVTRLEPGRSLSAIDPKQ